MLFGETIRIVLKPFNAFVVQDFEIVTKEANYYGAAMPFLRIPDMHGKMYTLRTKVMLSNYGAQSQPQKTLPSGSVSVSCIATPGLVILNHREIQTNQQINSVVPKESSYSKYLYWSCKYLSTEIETGGVGGSVFGNMNKSTFSALRISGPCPATIHAFDQLVSPIHAIILAKEEQSETMARVREALLPKLVSGEIRVAEAAIG